MHFIRLLRLLDIIVVLEWGGISKLFLPEKVVNKDFSSTKIWKNDKNFPVPHLKNVGLSLKKFRVLAQKVSGSRLKSFDSPLESFCPFGENYKLNLYL